MVSSLEEAPTLVCLFVTDSRQDTQGGRNYRLLVTLLSTDSLSGHLRDEVFLKTLPGRLDLSTLVKVHLNQQF